MNFEWLSLWNIENYMTTLFVIGEKKNHEWIAQTSTSAGFSVLYVSSLAELPASGSNGAVYLSTLNGISVASLNSLIRAGFHLFLNNPFELTATELNNVSLLAEEAGVYVFPRLPMELKVPAAVGSSPLVGSVSLELQEVGESENWRNRCFESISGALSILPYAVKRIRCVSGNRQADSPSFLGCHLEFENSSLISISISNASNRNSMLVQFLDSSGSYRYFEGSHENGEVSVKSQSEQLLQFIEICNSSKRRFSVLGLDTITQIMHIYSEMKCHFALA